MEALPRLPMFSFELLTTSEKVSFGSKIKQYIASAYHEDPESYNNEIQALEGLRATAVWPSIDINSCQQMKKYYCQLNFLKSRFPMEENQAASVHFSWKDEYTKQGCNVPDINFELMCVLINIGCIHSKLGAEDSRLTPEGMKMACTHFQCAAWAFQTVRETYPQLIGLIMISSEQLKAMQLVCLAQAQECILEKSLLDNRKASIITKIAVQLYDYYRQAWMTLQSGDDCMVLDHLSNHKYLAHYLQFKISFYRSIGQLYQGIEAEESGEMGMRVAFYQAADHTLEEAVKQISKISRSQAQLSLFKDTIAFTMDVVKAKSKIAENENEFIYHVEVPELSSLREVKGASLVKGIPFNIHDNDVSGNDIFARLVPMEAHEASSMYSERKAELLRNIGERIEKRELELCDFLNSMQLEVLEFVKQSCSLPQDLVDRAASMVAKPNATKDLVESMGKLSNSYQDVEAMLNEIQDMLKVEDELEKDYQTVMGKRPPSIIATDLAREFTKYQEAHGKASESNLNLHKVMTTHVANIKLLAQPLSQLAKIVPMLQLPDPNVDEQTMEQMQALISKVEEMKNQRIKFWTQLRDAVQQDDITSAIVTKETDQPLDVVFQKELEKHSNLTALIDQNLLAQDNICKALVETYAKFTPTRKYLQDLFHKRNFTLAALISSHDTYDDLLLKANKGIEFYAKLETNVSKLLDRIKSACKVQQEERDQMLLKNGHTKQNVHEEDVGASAIPPNIAPINLEPQLNTSPQVSKLKLKDYLNLMKENNADTVTGSTQMQYPNSAYPVHQESSNLNWRNNESYNQDAYKQPAPISAATVSGYTQPTTISGYTQPAEHYQNAMDKNLYNNAAAYTQPSYAENNVNQLLVDKMNALKIPTNTTTAYDNYNMQTYAGYNYSTPSDVAYTNTVGSTVTPTMAATQTESYYPQQEQYNPNMSNYTAYNNYASTAPTKFTNDTNTNYKPTAYDQASAYYNYEQNPQHLQQVHPSANNSNAAYYNYGAQQQLNDTAAGVSQYQGYSAYNKDTNIAASLALNNITQSYDMNYANTSAANTRNSLPISSTTYTANQYSYAPSTNVPYGLQTSIANLYSSYDPNINQIVAATSTPPPPSTTPNLNPYNNQVPYATHPTQNPTPPPPSVSDGYAQNYFAGTNSTVAYNSTAASQQQQYNNMTSNVYPYSTNLGANLPNTDTTSANNYASYSNQQQYNSTLYPQGNEYNNQYTNGLYDYSQSGYTANAAYAYQGVQQPAVANIANPPVTATNAQTNGQYKKESSIDLLAGLDFSISQAPLIPVKEEKKKQPPDVIEILPPKKIESPSSNKPQTVEKKKKVKFLTKGVEPFKNPDTVKQFLIECDKFEKYVEGLAAKTLSGPSNLELRWKEIQEAQDSMESTKKSISVARCYPLKNRSPDFLPYDYSRVELLSLRDDYINASHVGMGPYCMDFIITQLPMQYTVEEFWAMIWEQQVETVVCLLSDNEINEGRYWPSETGKDLNVNRRVILAHHSANEFWTERTLTISDEKESRLINIFQYTAWPGSLFPTNGAPLIDFLKLIIKSYERQKCSGCPVLVHCLSGVGRSGICCTLLAALMELNTIGCPLPDIPAIAAKISCARKNALRDREHLRFIYTTLLQHMKTIRNEYTRSDIEKADDQGVKEAPVLDPLSALDPLWASKKI